MKSYPIKTIYLVDDHESVIAGLKFVLEQNDNFKVIGGNTSVEIALAEIHSKKPHIAIIDYNLNGDTNGIELIKLIKRKRISTKCVLFSLRNDNELIFAAKEAGAQGYFSKGTPNKILRSKIEEIAFSDKLIFDEDSKQTEQNLFSQKLCKDWEEIALKAQDKTRVVLLRTGVVVGEGGGIIKKLTPPFKLGLGGKIGDGTQIMSWIHLDDIMGILNLIMNNFSIAGAINLVSPNACSNHEFSQKLAKKFARPYLFHMPKIVAKNLFGKMGEELLLSSQKIAPHKAVENGYDFKFSRIEDAIEALFKA
jgi:DNA-binding NarL/FixJ family response regulator